MVQLEDGISCMLHPQKQSLSERRAVSHLSARSNASFAASLQSGAVKRLSDVCCGGSLAMKALVAHVCTRLLSSPLPLFLYRRGVDLLLSFPAVFMDFPPLTGAVALYKTPERSKSIMYPVFYCSFLTSQLIYRV